MRREAEQHAAEDAKRKGEVETRNMADNLAYTAEKTLREQGDKVPADLKSEVEGKVAAVRSALSGSDITYLQSTVQELSEAMQKIGATVYQQTAQPPEGEAPGEQPGGKGEEGTIEGEFREV